MTDIRKNLAILAQIPALRKDLYQLLLAIKKGIDRDTLIETGDGFVQGIDVTVGCTFDFDSSEISWSYQTGDNSFTGGAYGHPEWFNASVFKRTNCRDAANDLINEIHDRIQECASFQEGIK